MKPMKKIYKKILAIWKKLKLFWKIVVIILLITIINSIISLFTSSDQDLDLLSLSTPVIVTDLAKEIIRSGQVELQGVIEVTPPISGTIEELNVQNGQEVAIDDILFTIKSSASGAEQANAYAAYLSAQKTYQESIDLIGRQEWLDFETARTAMTKIEEEIKQYAIDYPDQANPSVIQYQELLRQQESARLTLDKALAETTLINNQQQIVQANWRAAQSAYQSSQDGDYLSPITGRVENLGVNQGESVRADIGDTTGTPLFLLIPSGNKTISLSLGAKDAQTVQIGSQAKITTSLLPDQEFTATVVRLDKVAQTNSNSDSGQSASGANYRVWLELADPEDQILLGTSVQVTLAIEAKTGILAVPSDAISDNQVQIVDQTGNVLETRAVTTGLESLGMTEITSGVVAGELIAPVYDFLAIPNL